MIMTGIHTKTLIHVQSNLGKEFEPDDADLTVVHLEVVPQCFAVSLQVLPHHSPPPSNFIKTEAGWCERQMITMCSPD